MPPPPVTGILGYLFHDYGICCIDGIHAWLYPTNSLRLSVPAEVLRQRPRDGQRERLIFKPRNMVF
jgi:hypothetical protein